MGGANRNQENQVLDIKVTKEGSQGFIFKRNLWCQVWAQAPSLLFYSIASEDNDSVLGLGQYCIPIAPNNCRIIARFPFHLNIKPAMYAMQHTPCWITHFSQNVVMDSDVVFFASQDEKLSLTNQEPNYYMPAKCDSMVRAFRKWLTAFGGDGPEWLVGDSCGQKPWRAIWLDSTNECTSSRRPRCLVGALSTTLGYMHALHVAVLIRHCMLCASAWRLLEFSSWLLHLLWLALLLDHGEWRQLLVLACCYCLNYFIDRSLEDWNVHHGPGRNGCDQVHCEDSAILADHHDGDLELFWLAWGRFLSSITDSTTYSMIGL
jgi:hypothetical protein